MMPYLIQGCNDAVYVYIRSKKLLIRVHGKGCSITYHLSHKHIKNTIIRDMGLLYFFLTAEANLSQFKFKLVALVGSKLSGSKRICSRSLIVEDFNTMECGYPLWFFWQTLYFCTVFYKLHSLLFGEVGWGRRISKHGQGFCWSSVAFWKNSEMQNCKAYY